MTLPKFADINITAEWNAFYRSIGQYPKSLNIGYHAKWFRHLETLVSDPPTPEEFYAMFRRCSWCNEFTTDYWTDDNHGYSACRTRLGNDRTSCYDRYVSRCTGCDVEGANFNYINDGRWCQACTDDRFEYCDGCDEYHAEGDECPTNCDCNSPQIEFTIPNGDGVLANDVMATVSLPVTDISADGLITIRRRLAMYNITVDSGFLRNEVGLQRTNDDGAFVKRLSKALYKRDKTKMPAHVTTAVGNDAAAHSGGGELRVEVTRKINGPAGKFGNAGSCWWGGYTYSRCALKSHGGFALRTFDERGKVSGRAWVMPVKEITNTNGQFRLRPTFNTENPDAWIVFNCYGELQNYYGPRVLAAMVGQGYSKVYLDVDESEMYINNRSGYLVGPEDLRARHVSDNVRLGELDPHSVLFEIERNNDGVPVR